MVVLLHFNTQQTALIGRQFPVFHTHNGHTDGFNAAKYLKVESKNMRTCTHRNWNYKKSNDFTRSVFHTSQSGTIIDRLSYLPPPSPPRSPKCCGILSLVAYHCIRNHRQCLFEVLLPLLQPLTHSQAATPFDLNKETITKHAETIQWCRAFEAVAISLAWGYSQRKYTCYRTTMKSICDCHCCRQGGAANNNTTMFCWDRKSTRLNSSHL